MNTKFLDKIIDKLIDETIITGIEPEYIYSWNPMPPPHVSPYSLKSRHVAYFINHLRTIYGVSDYDEFVYIWDNYRSRLNTNELSHFWSKHYIDENINKDSKQQKKYLDWVINETISYLKTRPNFDSYMMGIANGSTIDIPPIDVRVMWHNWGILNAEVWEIWEIIKQRLKHDNIQLNENLFKNVIKKGLSKWFPENQLSKGFIDKIAKYIKIHWKDVVVDVVWDMDIYGEVLFKVYIDKTYLSRVEDFSPIFDRYLSTKKLKKEIEDALSLEWGLGGTSGNYGKGPGKQFHLSFEVIHLDKENKDIKESINNTIKEQINISNEDREFMFRTYKEMGLDEEWAQYDLEELLKWLDTLPEKIILYRLLYIDDDNIINREELGDHYTQEKESLLHNHYSKGSIYGGHWGNPVLLTVEADKDQIDILNTLHNNILYPHEEEITLKNKGRGIKIKGVEKI